MPTCEDLLVLLSGIHVTDRNRRRAYAVAGHLVAFVLKERWHRLPERQRKILIRDSSNRLWDDYMEKRRFEDVKPKEAARDAILTEKTVLKELLNPNKAKRGLLEQLDDF